MTLKPLLLLSILLLTLLLAGGRAAAGGDELLVLSVSPAARSLDAMVDTAVVIEFDRAVNPATVTGAGFGAFGRWSGPAVGTISFADGDRQVILQPDQPFSAGEPVMVVLSNSIEAADGGSLRSAGYSFQFWVRSTAALGPLTTIQVLSTRSQPDQGTRAYGGVATDFNDDNWLDMAIINEDSADVRVFLNQADGSGQFDDFLTPPTAVNVRASPNEVADFNGDGWADLAVANINTGTVSILLGNGDGTFQPQQEVAVGTAPRGLAVLDADGDGDIDIVNTNSGGVGVMSLLLNNGSGVFGPASFFEGGASGEWALAAADMDEDGILDLVIGAQSSSQIVVSRGNGDGTFSFLSVQNAGGGVWMLNAADVNGDGHVDVAAANSFNHNGAILLGDGAGQLAAPVLTPTDPFTIATDLGDIDGDGDLDWVTSSFSGDWLLFLNDGSGAFTFEQRFAAPQAASCALMLDVDNDGDLDLALIDELDDTITIVQRRQQAGYLPLVKN